MYELYLIRGLKWYFYFVVLEHIVFLLQITYTKLMVLSELLNGFPDFQYNLLLYKFDLY